MPLLSLLDFDNDGKLDTFLPSGGFFKDKEIHGHPEGAFTKRLLLATVHVWELSMITVVEAQRRGR